MFSRNAAHAPHLEAIPHERLISADPAVPARACCCPARPVVRVCLPPSPARPSCVDLWLCGHHYRSSLAALDAAGALIEFIDGEGNQFFRPAAVAAA